MLLDFFKLFGFLQSQSRHHHHHPVYSRTVMSIKGDVRCKVAQFLTHSRYMQIPPITNKLKSKETDKYRRLGLLLWLVHSSHTEPPGRSPVLSTPQLPPSCAALHPSSAASLTCSSWSCSQKLLAAAKAHSGLTVSGRTCFPVHQAI